MNNQNGELELGLKIELKKKIQIRLTKIERLTQCNAFNAESKSSMVMLCWKVVLSKKTT